MSSNRDIEQSMSSPAMPAVVIGNEVLVVAQWANGKPFVFSRLQTEFLIQLQRLKNVAAAALAVRQQEEWALGFLKSRKFRAFVNAKLEEFSAKNACTVEWWYQFGKQVAEGKREFYKVNCPKCEYAGELEMYAVEAHRQDDMSIEMPCDVCYAPVVAVKVVKPFAASREQMQAWSEIGSRLLPKIERVHHAFEKTEMVFETQEGA